MCFDPTWVGYTRLVLPPGLRERLTFVERSESAARIGYTVLNPSWLTCYPAHTHRGEVALETCEGGTAMTWRVHVRPLRLGRWAVELLTVLIVPAFARNLTLKASSLSAWAHVGRPPRRPAFK